MIRALKMLHPSYSQQELCRSLGVSRQAHHKSSARTARVVMGREALVPLIREIRKSQPKVGGRKLYKMLELILIYRKILVQDLLLPIMIRV